MNRTVLLAFGTLLLFSAPMVYATDAVLATGQSNDSDGTGSSTTLDADNPERLSAGNVSSSKNSHSSGSAPIALPGNSDSPAPRARTSSWQSLLPGSIQ